jgi:hypothetical protein
MKKSVLTLVILMSGHILNAQCAMCKAVVESGNASEAESLNTGIVYLMVFPYLLVGVLFYIIINNRKKSKL